eukprot:TRINITY_DN6131_c0_g1_i10.p1 TRINITY_DN6131_c0_g1~~TRINITY_DN6131_c0_g1_i10.p1  ORF type:complete len:294 (-),score=55.77 TRINITY_DN6131_c0_g1_i10:919-1800(-)
MSSDQANHTDQPILDELPSQQLEQQQQLQTQKQRELLLVSVVKDLSQERDFWMNMKMKETRRVRELELDLQIADQFKQLYKTQQDRSLEEQQKLKNELEEIKDSKKIKQQEFELLEQQVQDSKSQMKEWQKNYKELEKEKITNEDLLNQRIALLVEEQKQSKLKSVESNFKQIAVTTNVTKNSMTDVGDDIGAELIPTTPQEEKGNQTDEVRSRGRKRGMETVGKLTVSNKKQKLVKTPLKKVYEEEEEEQDDDEQDTRDEEVKQSRGRRRTVRVKDSQDKGSQSKYNLRRRN